MNMPALKLSGRARLPLILQNEVAECGLACIAMVAAYYGHAIDIATLRKKYRSSLLGMTLKQLIELASTLKLSSRPLSVQLESVNKVQLPAIIHWEMNHYVVLHSIRGRRYYVHDPAAGERVLEKEEFSRHFTGVVLELSPAAGFQKKKEHSRLRLQDLWEHIHGLKHNLLQLLLLSCILQVFVLVTPFYLQLAIDEVLSSFDKQLMLALGLGFSGVVIMQFVTQTLRAYVVLYLGSMLGYQMSANLFRHMICLPLPFFERRHTGDIISRFGSMGPLQAMLSEGFISGLVDGVMTLSTLSLMIIYSPLLSAIAIIAWLAYFLLRIAFYRPYREAQQEAIQKAAIEDSTLIETLRGMTSIKLLGGEKDRINLWQSRYAEMINANARSARFALWFESANQLISGLEHVLIVYVAVNMSMAGEFTVGMIFAFMAYKRNFTENATELVEKIIEYRMLDLHLDRIADIALTEKENHGQQGKAACYRQAMPLNLVNLSFDYDGGEKQLIDSLNLEVLVGEYIAITGPSGCGKTTLLKLMTGLIQADAGTVNIGRQSIFEYGLSRYRQSIGVVMQEDTLFSGSIAENIGFFAEDLDMDRVLEAASLAVVDNEILNLPMGFESLIGDMGSALSAGQKQRIILARALYQRPSILFLDEGTAHLDTVTEKRLNESIKGLGITRICIAHRPGTIAYADRVLKLEDGRLLTTQDVLNEQG